MEIIEEKQPILIVSKEMNELVPLLKSELKKYDAQVFFSSRLPSHIEKFHYCFFINEKIEHRNISSHIPKSIYIFLNQEHVSEKLLKTIGKRNKVICIQGNILRKEDIDRILWFFLSQTQESLLKFSVPTYRKPRALPAHQKMFDIKKTITLKHAVFFFLAAVFLLHIVFIFPMAFSSYYFLKAADALKQEDVYQANRSTVTAELFLKTTKRLYSFSRPTLLLFSIALFPDDIINMNEKAGSILQESILLSQNSKQIVELFFKKDKTPEEKDSLLVRMSKLQDEITSLEKNCYILSQKIPSNIAFLKKTKQELTGASETLIALKKILPYLDFFMAKNDEKKFLLLFANNMELRPGGGFIGSFGVLTIKDLTFEDISIYDVYDADGQLKAHIDPPEPIRLYLNQPHWFLRDSAFSADFIENYSQAKFFLDREMNLRNFSGAFLITTSAIENILGAFDSIYIPDFNEQITQKNFYLKAQIYSEKNFFPGSIQKKSFLSSLTRQLLIRMENVSSKKLIQEFKKSLDEKQIVLYIDEPSIQHVIDSFYWSGGVIKPQCTTQIENCIVDFLFPIDANLGVNKANFFVRRQILLKTNISQEGVIHHTLSVLFKNESAAEVFPGGTYRNYFQVLLPRNTTVDTVTKNGILVETMDEENEEIKTIGFYFEVPPQKTTEIKINYTLENNLKKGKGVYQLIVQKQIGSSNNDFIFQLHLPKNIFTVNQNFSPLVKNSEILYNTNLSADKIFFIELLRE